MSQRLKVLLSAYACEPGKGSEQEVGWQWALHLARFHDVTVLTRANNRVNIERGLAQLCGTGPVPQFVYHEEGGMLLELKRRLHTHRLYYLLWQRTAREVVARLHQTHNFHLLHHLTFAGFRFPTAVWGHGIPCLWGPIGGMESVPLALLPWNHPHSLVQELGRNYNNFFQAPPINLLGKRIRASTTVLATTVETQVALRRLGYEAQLMPTIGLDTENFPAPATRPPSAGPLKLLFVGNIITLKGVGLALQALKASGTNAHFTLIGSGDYRVRAQRLAEKLGLQSQVEFKPRIPREDVLKTYQNYDAFLFPSLHDTGGYAVIEAMLNGLPVICLDCGGPGIAVTPDCGFKATLESRAGVIATLASFIQSYDRNRPLVRQHGQAARQSVIAHYDWHRKAEAMNIVYARTLELAATPEHQQRLKTGYDGVGNAPRLLSKMFASKGMITLFLTLLLVGLLGFISTSYLRTKAQQLVGDTLPSLSYAGAANACLAQGVNRTVLLVVTEDPVRRAQLRAEITQFSELTTQYLDDYSRQPMNADVRLRFQTLLKLRDDYIQLRTHVLELDQRGEKTAALAAINTDMMPAYDKYREAGEDLLSYEIADGRSRSQTILRVGTATQIIVAAVGIILFMLGFFIGIFK